MKIILFTFVAAVALVGIAHVAPAVAALVALVGPTVVVHYI